MPNILRSFIPWILFFALFSPTTHMMQLTAVAALAAHIIINWRSIRRGYVLDIGGLVFFIAYMVNVFIINNNWISTHGYLLSNAAIAIIAWLSLIIRQPFTAQYARESVAKETSHSPLFKLINYVLTTLWAILLSLMLAPNLIEHFYTLPDQNSINIAVSIGLMVIGAKLTEWLPDYLVEKVMSKHFTIDIKKIYHSNKTPDIDFTNFNSEQLSNTPDQQVAVTIIGAGPVGLTAALLLQQHGIDTLVIEKHPGTASHPKARGISARSMELFRRLGIESQVASHSLPASFNGIRWFDALAGTCFTHIKTDNNYTDISPSSTCSGSQPELEKELLKTYQERGGTVLFEHTAVNIAQNADRAQVTIHHRQNKQQRIIESRYIIAADGVHSFTRQLFNIPMWGPKNLSTNVSIYCKVNLDHIISEDKRFSLGFIVNENGGSPMANPINGKDEWIFLFPAGGVSIDKLKAIYTEDYAKQKIIETIGDEVAIDIISIQTWTLGSQVANQAVLGRTILAGDSLHQFTPTGGMGMNTGLQDADNLAWKLAYILQGKADPSLINTYTQERIPAILHVLDWSLSNLKNIIAVHQALNKVTPGSKEFSRCVRKQHQHMNRSGIDLGTIYQSDIIKKTTQPQPIIDPKHYQPHIYPGARMPHKILTHNNQTQSSLDWLDNDFTLFCPSQDRSVAKACHFGTWPTKIIASDAFTQAIWVRPDGHIAWCGDINQFSCDDSEKQ